MIILLFSAAIPITSPALARDPTTPSYPIPKESSTLVHDEELIVSAIWISAKTRRARLNGVIARQGQIILNGIKVIQIRHNSVTVQQNGVIKTLQLVQRPYKTPAK
jgi:hypothetical protein